MAREKRSHIRYPLSGHLPGTMVNSKGEVLESLIVDISAKGLGLLLDPGPQMGDILSLQFNTDHVQEVKFEVKWSLHSDKTQQLPGLHDMCRCGLLILDDSDDSLDLIEIMNRFDGIDIEI